MPRRPWTELWRRRLEQQLIAVADRSDVAAVLAPVQAGECGVVLAAAGTTRMMMSVIPSRRTAVPRNPAATAPPAMPEVPEVDVPETWESCSPDKYCLTFFRLSVDSGVEAPLSATVF